MTKQLQAIGLMSGTSLDGVDAAIIKSDGEEIHNQNLHHYIPYPKEFQEKLRIATLARNADAETIKELTDYHIQAVNEILAKYQISPADIDVIGMHGQALLHDPANKITIQVGDAVYLANTVGINVVHNFRQNDINNGGQGAPLVPLYHKSVAAALPKPVVFLNIGGIANITYIDEEYITAFDTGPGNVLLDEVAKDVGLLYDFEGKLASHGEFEQNMVDEFLKDEYFLKTYPKSLDRNHFIKYKQMLDNVKLTDRLATLTEYTVQSIAKAIEDLPKKPVTIYVHGGGRRNFYLISRLKLLVHNLQPIEILGLDGDFTEAEAFAFFAIRSVYGLPLSLPTTTGVERPVTGGDFVEAA